MPIIAENPVNDGNQPNKLVGCLKVKKEHFHGDGVKMLNLSKTVKFDISSKDMPWFRMYG